MGVSLYIVRAGKRCRILVGDQSVVVGALERMPWKLSAESDLNLRVRENLETRAAKSGFSPAAVIVDAQYSNLKNLDGRSACGLLLGWEDNRTSVSDYYWDHLPELGYLVRDPNGALVLHEKRSDALLVPMDVARAQELGFMGSNGRLIIRGQPKVVACTSVRRFLEPREIITQEGESFAAPGYLSAACTLENGSHFDLLMKIDNVLEDDQIPHPDLLLGKTPREVLEFCSKVVPRFIGDENDGGGNQADVKKP